MVLRFTAHARAASEMVRVTAAGFAAVLSGASSWSWALSVDTLSGTSFSPPLVVGSIEDAVVGGMVVGFASGGVTGIPGGARRAVGVSGPVGSKISGTVPPRDGTGKVLVIIPVSAKRGKDPSWGPQGKP